MRSLLLRFDAPLMSFGGVLVDQHNPTDRFPGRALLCGLIGNALGWHHADSEALDALQARIVYAARWDVQPEALRDYHTVDLGQPHLAAPGWTSRGEPEHREGGSSKKATHQRYRHYWANGVLTIALTLLAGEPDIERVGGALQHPARPLFIGRKACLPASRLVLGFRDAPNSLAALQAEPRDSRAPAQEQRFEACWPPGCVEPTLEARQLERWTDERDWHAQAHVGQRAMVIGHIDGVPLCT